MPPPITSNREGNGCSKPQTRTIAVNAASIELRETIRAIASTMPKTVAAPNPTGHDIASKTPSPVAADLPPVKFSQIDRLCPNSTAIPAKQTAYRTQICKSNAVGGVGDNSVWSQGQ